MAAEEVKVRISRFDRVREHKDEAVGGRGFPSFNSSIVSINYIQ